VLAIRRGFYKRANIAESLTVTPSYGSIGKTKS